ncbi:MAG: S-layer homology domain-containing protein [Clostridia bacterium]|nr:S-layer homology domain-containing protein [Clostridia bacterium]
MKRVIIFSVVTAIFVGTLCMSAFAADLPFTDVKKGAWYEDAVETVYTEGIMEGKAEGKFEPNSPMTRAELVTVLCRLSGDDADGKGETLSFADTKKSAWYADFVAWAAESGIVAGYEDNTFKPNAPVLRCELAKMFVTFLEYMEITEKGTALVDSFADADSFPKWAAEYIESLRETGLMGGDDAGKFKPKSNASRAEIATVITRLLPLMEEEEPPETGKPAIDTSFVRWNPSVILEKLVPQEPFDSTNEVFPFDINWRLYVPDDYDPEKKYPVLLFLHGAGEIGTNNTSQLNNMSLHLFNQSGSSIRDTICIFPQTPIGWWDTQTLYELMEHVASLYSTDTDRYYIMGLSMGGHGTWHMIAEYPEYFAAAIPICGAGDSLAAPSLSHMPIYIVHGAKDDTVSVECSRRMSTALKSAGNTVFIYEELPNYGHNAWDHVSQNKEIMIWLFEQTNQAKK